MIEKQVVTRGIIGKIQMVDNSLELEIFVTLLTGGKLGILGGKENPEDNGEKEKIALREFKEESGITKKEIEKLKPEFMTTTQKYSYKHRRTIKREHNYQLRMYTKDKAPNDIGPQTEEAKKEIKEVLKIKVKIGDKIKEFFRYEEDKRAIERFLNENVQNEIRKRFNKKTIGNTKEE